MAKQSYTKAAEKALDNQPLLAAARFGLGLCEEELGNFDAARQIYSEVADNAAFEGTVSVAQAKFRLETMADYKGNVVFRPKPKPKLKTVPLDPVTIQMKPDGANSPSAAMGPLVTMGPVDTKPPVQEPNKAAAKPEIKIVPVEPNVPAKAPEPKAPAVAVPLVVEPNITPETTEPNDTGM